VREPYRAHRLRPVYGARPAWISSNGHIRLSVFGEERQGSQAISSSLASSCMRKMHSGISDSLGVKNRRRTSPTGQHWVRSAGHGVTIIRGRARAAAAGQTWRARRVRRAHISRPPPFPHSRQPGTSLVRRGSGARGSAALLSYRLQFVSGVRVNR
jgi:hypothetical protein